MLAAWGYTRGMPKISVYLPEDLHAEVQRRSLPLSRLTQQAIREAIRADEKAAWVERMRLRVERGPMTRARTSTDDLMAAVAEEFGA